MELMGRDGESLLLATLAKNLGVLSEHKGRLKELHFVTPTHKLIFMQLMKLGGSGRIPTKTEILHLLFNSPGVKKQSALFKSALKKDIERVFESDASDAVLDTIRHFIALREMTALSKDIDDEVHKASVDERVDAGILGDSVSRYIKRLENIQAVLKKDQELEHYENIFSAENLDNWEEFIDDVNQIIVPWPWKKLNEKHKGGMMAGELYLYVGTVNIGKTTAMVSLSSWLAIAGYRVLYIGLDNTKREMKKRFEASISGIPETEEAQRSEVVERIKNAVAPDSIHLLIFPRGSMSVQELRNETDTLEKRLGYKFDVTIVDYLQTIKGAKQTQKEDNWSVNNETAGLLANWAQADNRIVVVPTQTNKLGLNTEVQHLGNIAEGFGQSFPPSAVLAAMQTTVEYAEGRMRIGVLKSRHGPKNFMIPCRVDYGRQRIVEAPFESVIWIREYGTKKSEGTYHNQDKLTAEEMKETMAAKSSPHPG